MVKAHVAAKERGLKLIVGSEFTLTEGIRLVALVPSREAYGELSGLISRARRRSGKGEYRVHLRDVIFHLKRCLLILLPDDTDKSDRSSSATGKAVQRAGLDRHQQAAGERRMATLQTPLSHGTKPSGADGRLWRGANAQRQTQSAT